MVYNVTSGKGVSINELAESLLGTDNMFGKKVEILYDDPRLGDVRYSSADISKIEKAGFEPKCSLKDGLKKTSDCFSKETIVNF